MRKEPPWQQERQRRLVASRDEVRRLGALSMSEVAPSRRDFAQYVATQRTELAVIARLAYGPTPSNLSALIDYARACDDAEVAALAVVTEPDGLSVDDMAALAAAVTAPVLYDALTIDPSQLYHARLHGADAAVFPVGALDDAALHDLVTVASSLHMASVVEVLTMADLRRALALAHVIVGLRCEREDGSLDLEHTRQLAQHIPPARTVLGLPEAATLADYRAARGVCDAVVVGEVLRTAVDLATRVRQITDA
jgi:indole-3-glycerol phosphate synthase